MASKQSQSKPKKTKKSTTNASSAASTALIPHAYVQSTEQTKQFQILFKSLKALTPKDQSNFPTYILDPQMIPPNYTERPPKVQENIIQAASTKIYNVEGYPAHSFSTPIWKQLPHEPHNYYKAFTLYLSSPQRDLTLSQSVIANYTDAEIQEVYEFYYWPERARAYDIFKPVAAARLRDERVFQTENMHFELSATLTKNLVDEVEKRSEENDGRPFAGLSANELIKSIIASAELQRISVGLPARGPKLQTNEYVPSPHASIDRNVREGVLNYDGQENDSLSIAQQNRKRIDDLMAKDPEQAAKLQDVVLNMLLEARQNSENTGD